MQISADPQGYQPPTDILHVLEKIGFEEALEPDDPRRVDTQEARGSQKTLDRLARKFGLMMDDRRFVPPRQKHALFFGHVGAGKTTELKYYAQQIAATQRMLPIEVDVPQVLDRNNLQYADLLMAMAQALLLGMQHAGVSLQGGALNELERWFAEQVNSRTELKEFATSIETGIEARSGLPFLGSLFAKFSASFKANATYKEELRQVIRNTFAQFADAFNQLIQQAEGRLAEQLQLPQGERIRILFIIDGTDKLRFEDTLRMFVQDAELLLSVDTFAIYTAPIALKFHGELTGKLDTTLMLPMMKLQQRDGTRCESGWTALRAILLKRADVSLFATEAEVAALIDASGGHPRELLRLLQLCCEFADDQIDADVVRQAIKQLAAEYRWVLEPDDYPVLVATDHDHDDAGKDDRIRRLLLNLAQLEYNDGSWRRSHPVVRTLEGYARAEAAWQAATAAAAVPPLDL